MSKLGLVEVESGQYVVLRISGMIDSESAPLLDAACERVLAGSRHLVLNLAEVSFITSSGVGVLLSSTELFRDEGFDLICAESSHEVRTVFDLLNLNEFLTLKETEEQAIAMLRKAA